MAPIVDVINPMLALVAAGEVLRVIETYSRPIFLPVRFVVGHFGQQTVCAHHFCDKLVIPRAMGIEFCPVYLLMERLC